MTEPEVLRKLKHIEPFINLVRLGAEICVWCGNPVPKEKWTTNFYFTKTTSSDALWLPGLPEDVWICHQPCSASLKAHAVSECLKYLNQKSIADAARNQNT